MESMMVNQKQNILISEQDVARNSIQLGNKSYNTDDALKVALIIIECFSREVLSPDVLQIVKCRVVKMRPDNISETDYCHLITSIFTRADMIRKSNTISGMF